LKEGGELGDGGVPGGVVVAEVAGVEADGVGEAGGVLPFDGAQGGLMLRGEGGVEVPVGGAGADGDEAGDAGGGGAVEDGGEVAAVGEGFEVAVGVEEHEAKMEDGRVPNVEFRGQHAEFRRESEG
jgi:hypothetical protein